jgi:4'-phosphopantetheinyl transferase
MAAYDIIWHFPPSKLKLSINDVHVWRVRLNQADGRVQQLHRILSNDEQRRAERFHFDRDRRRFIVRRGTLRLIIGDYFEREPGRLQFHSGHRGKPYLMNSLGKVPLQFNLAHSKEIALYAFTSRQKIGIDIEYVRDMPDAEKIAQTTYSSLENKTLQSLPEYQRQEAFFNCWVRKEAYIKAIGSGLYHALDRFDVSLAPGEPARVMSIEGSAAQASGWFMKSLNPEDGYVAALAVKGTDFRLSYWRYPEKYNNLRKLPLV